MNILQQLLGGSLSPSPQENVIKEQPIKSAVDKFENVWGGLQINRPEFYKLKRGKGMGAGFGDGGGGGGFGFSLRGGGKQSSPLHYMDSGLDGLNDLSQFPIPTYSEDPLYYQNVMNQQKNMDANGYWTGPKEHKPIVKVNGEWKFLKDLDAEEKAWVVDTSERFGEGIEGDFLADPALNAGGGMTGGPLSNFLTDPVLNAGGGMTGGPLTNFLTDPVFNAGGGMTGGPLTASVIRSADAIDAAGGGMTGGPLAASDDYNSGWDFLTGVPHELETLLSAIPAEDKQKVYDTSHKYGSGFDVSDYTVAGPLSAAVDYQTPVQEYVSSTPVQEYVSNNYDTGYVGTGKYSGMSYGL